MKPFGELNKLPTDLLQECVKLEEGGKLVWRERPLYLFKSERDYRRWNTTWKDKLAFNTVNNYGYLAGRLLGKSLYAHRVVWALHYGEFPSLWVDHIDGDRRNNDPSNLREVTYKENNKNATIRSDNKTGVAGVHKKGEKFVATIKDLTGKQLHLGAFSTLEEASACRANGEFMFGYHSNHGKTK